jgi:hypothetical protein
MKPIILDYAINRKEERNPIFKYDFKESLNIISVGNDKKVPFIDSALDNLVLLTKTKANQESDDDNFNMLELQTKTRAARESDDNSFLFEAVTKTFTNRERDDESFNYY